MDESRTVEQWVQWREACALDRTPPDTREVLVSFLARRFLSALRKLNMPGLSPRLPGDRDRAHLFESWCALHQRADGKRYKDWLLTRGDRSLGAVESGVTLLLRKVALEWVRCEFDREPSLSLDAPVARNARGESLEELLPAPAAPLTFEEREWLQREIPRLLAEMNPVQRAAFAARAAGLPFSHPRVRTLSGAGKTALYHHHREAVLRVGTRVRDAFPEMDPARGLELTLRALESIASDISFPFFAEKSEPAG